MKYTHNNKDNLFFCSEPHAYHANILKYGRGSLFSTVDEMTDAIVDNWNSVVPKDGIVFCLGDVALTSKKKTHDFLDRLNGKIILILGNHDDASYFKHDKIIQIDNYCVLKVEGQYIILSHFPFRSWERRQYDSWNLHGHCHGMLPEDNSKQLDVGYDNHPNFRPFSFHEVEENMKTKVNLKIDSHERKTTFYTRLKKALKYLLKM